MWHKNIKIHLLKDKSSSLYESYLEKISIYHTQQKQKTFTVATEIM